LAISRNTVLILGIAAIASCDRSGSNKAGPENIRAAQSQPTQENAEKRVEAFAKQLLPLWRAALAKAAPFAPQLQAERAAQKDLLREPLVIDRLLSKPTPRHRFVVEGTLAKNAERLLRSFRDAANHGLDPQRYHLDVLVALAAKLGHGPQQAVDSPEASSQPTAGAAQAPNQIAQPVFGGSEKTKLKAWIATSKSPVTAHGAELLGILKGKDSPLPSLADAYRVALARRIETLPKLARFEILASDGLAAYARDLSRGNTNPQILQEKWRAGKSKKAAQKPTVEPPAGAPATQPTEPKKVDWPAWVVDKIVADLEGVKDDATLKVLLEALPPPFEQYSRLVKAMKSYRQIAAAGGWQKLKGSYRLRTNKKHKTVRELKARLLVEGHYSGPLDQNYDLALHDALRSYQRTHQFAESGRPDRYLWRSLNIPVERRMKSIAFALHRWRNSYIGEAPYYVYVNISDFHLEVWNGSKRVTRHRIIVGKSRGRKCDEDTKRWIPKFATPVQQARIQKLVFAPFWNVTKEIKETEYDPERGKDPLFYQKHGYEIMNDGERREWVRQMPGPGNSLGFVKFIFPNAYSVFVHDTPTKGLFNRPIRTFSHGCMRVQNPWDLAKTLLKQDGQWSEPKYRKLYKDWRSMSFRSLRTAWDPGLYDELREKASEMETTVRLALQTPIYVDYITARVDGGGKVHFLTDVYGEERDWLRPRKSRRCVPESVIARTQFAKLIDKVIELEQAVPTLTPRITTAQQTAANLTPKIAARQRRLLKKLKGLANFAEEHSNLAQNIRANHAALTTKMAEREGRWGRVQKGEAVKLWRLLSALTSMNAKADWVCKQIEKYAPKPPAVEPENGDGP